MFTSNSTANENKNICRGKFTQHCLQLEGLELQGPYPAQLVTGFEVAIEDTHASPAAFSHQAMIPPLEYQAACTKTHDEYVIWKT